MGDLPSVSPPIFMVLKQIITRNIQSHKEVVIDLPPTGLVVFMGNNSNGKSVIVKTLEALLTNKIAKPRKRNSLVNRNASFGEIICVRSDDAILKAHIQREAAGTYIELSLPGQETVTRYIADRTYRELVLKFGWHYSDEAGLSLNIAQEEDALLFYKNTPKKIRAVLDSATSDTDADLVAENLKAFQASTRKLREGYNQQQSAYMQTLSTIQIEETKPLYDKMEILEKCHRNLSVVYFPAIPEIKAVPKVSYVSPYIPEIPKIRYPRIVQVSCNIPDITKIARELHALKNSVCPTCGRGFDSNGCSNPLHN